MKAILFGLTGYGNAALNALQAAGFEVPLVFTRAEPGPFPHYPCAQLADEARALGAAVYEDADPDNEDTVFERIRAAAADVIVVASYHKKISSHVTKLARVAINLHPSLLPSYRSATPTNWALINGEKRTGVTLQYVARHLYGGDVVMRREVSIEKDDTNGTLRSRLATELGILLGAFLERMKRGETIDAIPQDEREITVYPPVGKRDAHIRFDQGNRQIVDRIRAMSPWPGAYTDFCGVEFPIASVAPEGPERYDDEPGRVLAVDDAAKTLRVKSMDGVLRLTVVDELNRLGAIAKRNADILQFAGKVTPFASKDFVSGGASYDVAMPSTEELERYLQFPDMVVLAVAYPCNAYCPNCPYTLGNSEIRAKYGDAQFIAPDLFKKIADECGEAGRRNWLPGGVGSMIRITGGGEPMMHPYGMTNLIEYAKGAGARVYLNSNGSLFKGADIDRLLALNVDNIEVSVDAGDRDTYEIVRKGLDWDHVLASLRYMIDRRNVKKSLTTIEVSVIDQQIVHDRIGEIERFWYDFGVDNVIVRKFLTWGSNTTIDPDDSGDPLSYLDRDAGVPCPYPFHRLNVDTRGKVEVCGFDISGRTNMGNVKEQTIREIWQGAMFSWWRKKHQDGQGGDIPLCAECPDWKYRSWEHNYRKALKNAGERRDAAWAITP